MAFYYVKTGGTATGDAGRYASRQTGSFATLGTANYYASTAAALAATTAPSAGDEICISTAHNFTSASQIVLSGPTGSAAVPLKYISVADANMDQSSIATSAQISTTATVDLRISGGNNTRTSFYGIYFSVEDSLRLFHANSTAYLSNCTIEAPSASDVLVKSTAAGGHITLNNCTLKCGNATNIPLVIQTSSILRMIGGSVTIASGTVNNLISGNGSTGGTVIELIGVDLSKIGNYLLADLGSGGGDLIVDLSVEGCKLNASLTGFTEEALNGGSKRISITRSSSSSSAAEYQFYKNSDQHIVDNNTTFFRDSSTAFTESSQKVSMKVVTGAGADRLAPFYFDLPCRYAELSSASADTLRLYLLSSDSGLTNQDVWAVLIYPDGTNKEMFNYLTSAATDPIATGTALTANSDAWTGRTTETRYQIDLDTSGDPGSDCAPILRIFIGKPSLTVYFDTTVDVVA